MTRNIDSPLTHRRDCLWSNTTRRNSSTPDVDEVIRHRAQQTFRHLTPGGVASAKNQNSFSLAHIVSRGFESNHRNKAAATIAPHICAAMKLGASMGLMPAKVSLTERASVTAGFANDVEAVNQ